MNSVNTSHQQSDIVRENVFNTCSDADSLSFSGPIYVTEAEWAKRCGFGDHGKDGGREIIRKQANEGYWPTKKIGRYRFINVLQIFLDELKDHSDKHCVNAPN